MSIVGLLAGFLLGALITGLVIWIVGKLRLGLEVDSFGSAFIAAMVIAITGAVLTWMLAPLGISLAGGWFGAIAYLIIAALVLLFAGRLLRGLRVTGAAGALIAAAAIGAVYWVLAWVVSLYF